MAGCSFSEDGLAGGDASAVPLVDARVAADAASGADAGAVDATQMTGPCPTGPEGLACVLALHDRALAGCAPDTVADLRTSLEARAEVPGALPVWHQGRALFVSFQAAAAVAGGFNDWVEGALVTAPVCGSDLFTAEASVPAGHHLYKVVIAGQWQLDPVNRAYAYDDFEGNPDGRNSVLNTHDSGRGHLLELAPACSDALGNCRAVRAYVPAGYGAPGAATRRYPVLFMHDGQNLFDDHDCCYGHTGWELNVTLDAEIAAGRVKPVVIVGADSTEARVREYGFSSDAGGLLETFMAFQTGELQPAAAVQLRIDLDRAYIAGSSLGGVAAFRLAFDYPQLYRGAASLSGAFWAGLESGNAQRDIVLARGKIAMPLYLDHGGTISQGDDAALQNLDLRDVLADVGWTVQTSPDCPLGPDTACYFHDVGAAHDELAWRDRSHRFLRFLLPAP